MERDEDKHSARWDEGLKIAAYLDRSVFPARREGLIHAAESKEASDRIVALLNQLPVELEFHNVGEVWRQLPGTNRG